MGAFLKIQRDFNVSLVWGSSPVTRNITRQKGKGLLMFLRKAAKKYEIYITTMGDRVGTDQTAILRRILICHEPFAQQAVHTDIR